MKRLLQFAALLAIGLFAVQPTLAAVPCLGGAQTPCVPGCPMAMDGMGADCPMNGATAISACPLNCCVQAIEQALPSLIGAERSKLAAGSASALHFSAVPHSAASPAFSLPIEARIASPPRYILNQVFRI